MPVATNILLMLTSSYIVVIEEELKIEQGWVVSYIPRSHVVGIQNQMCGAWNELTIQLKHGDQALDYKLTLKGETAEAWRSQWIGQGGKWQDLSNGEVPNAADRALR